MVFTTAKENKTEDRVQNEPGRFADYGSSGPEEPLGPSRQLQAPNSQHSATKLPANDHSKGFL